LAINPPSEKWQEVASQTLIHDEVEALFNPKKEKVKLQKWKSAQELKEVEKGKASQIQSHRDSLSCPLPVRHQASWWFSRRY